MIQSRNLNLTFWGALLGFLSVTLGAFAAHALSTRYNAQDLQILQTGNHYLFFHSFALLICGILENQRPELKNKTQLAGLAFALGILLFTGSLYLLVFTGIRKWGMITPLGGLSFLLGWGILAWSLRKQ